MQRAACDTTTREIFAGASYLYLPLPFRGEIATQIGLRARQPSLRTRRLDSRDLSKSAATAARGAGGWGGGGERNASVPRRDATRLARDTAASLTPPPPPPPSPPRFAYPDGIISKWRNSWFARERTKNRGSYAGVINARAENPGGSRSSRDHGESVERSSNIWPCNFGRAAIDHRWSSLFKDLHAAPSDRRFNYLLNLTPV